MQPTFELDALDRKLTDAFPGRVVRKDLVRQTKVGFNVPVYVLEYLLGQYCASTDPQIIAKGLDYVRETLSRNYVRADEGEKVKALTRQRGRHRILDKIKVRLDTGVDHFWAELVNLGVKDALIPDDIVHRNDKLLMGGIWALADLVYDPEHQERGMVRPFAIERIKPIQESSTDQGEFAAARQQFTTSEWLDVILRTIGLEPAHPTSRIARRCSCSSASSRWWRPITISSSSVRAARARAMSTGRSPLYDSHFRRPDDGGSALHAHG